MEWIIGLGIVLLFIILGNINKPYVGEQAPTLPDWKFNIMKMRDWDCDIEDKIIKEKSEINKN